VPILSEIIASVRRNGQSGLGANVPGNGLSGLRADEMIRALVAGYESYLAAQLKATHIVDKTPTIAPILARARSRPLSQQCQIHPLLPPSSRQHPVQGEEIPRSDAGDSRPGMDGLP
jgi:hypothetical protein